MLHDVHISTPTVVHIDQDMVGRRRSHVSTKEEHLEVLSWMMQTVYQSGNDDRIAAKAVSHPPFRYIFMKAMKDPDERIA